MGREIRRVPPNWQHPTERYHGEDRYAPMSYRPYSDEEATWFQVYETVSDGTPVSPPFATREELIDYLSTHGDFWDQNRGHGAWSREAAEKFVNVGWAPTAMVIQTEAGMKLVRPRDGIA